MSSLKHRIKSLDILRGIAILAVIFNHANNEIIPGQPDVSGWFGFLFWKIRTFGWSGVDLFFVLSGFLIGGLLFNELNKTGRINVVRFWLRREFKILPSYYFLLVVLAISGTTQFLSMDSLKGFLTAFSTHFFFFQNYLDQEPNGPTWSLAVEEHFYLFLPIFLMILAAAAHRRGQDRLSMIPSATVAIIVISLGVRIAALIFGHHKNDFMLTHNRCDSLFIGVFCQYLWMRHQSAVVKWAAKFWLWFPIGVLLIIPCMFFPRKHPAMFSIGFLGLACGYALILMLVMARGMGRFEKSRVASMLAAVGRWSYNIYLWHYFLPKMDPFGYSKIQMFLGRYISWPPVAVLFQVAVLIAFAIAGGWVFTKLIEQPFLVLRKKCTVSLRQASTSGPELQGSPAEVFVERPDLSKEGASAGV